MRKIRFFFGSAWRVCARRAGGRAGTAAADTAGARSWGTADRTADRSRDRERARPACVLASALLVAQRGDLRGDDDRPVTRDGARGEQGLAAIYLGLKPLLVELAAESGGPFLRGGGRSAGDVRVELLGGEPADDLALPAGIYVGRAHR